MSLQTDETSASGLSNGNDSSTEMLVCEESCGCKVFFLDEQQFSMDSGDLAYIEYCSMHKLATIPKDSTAFVTAYGDMLSAIREYCSPSLGSSGETSSWDKAYDALKKAGRNAEDAVL